MDKTRKIKEIIGSVLEERGIKYLRKEHGIVWNFERKVGEVVQNVIIQQHNQFDKEYKISFWTSARGNGVKEIGNILEEYKDKEYWPAETDEEFIKVLNFFASFIKDYGFDFGGVYEHHSHFNCWLCPLQRIGELQWIFENNKEYWDRLRDMQYQCDGYYQNGKTIFEFEKQFWEKHRDELVEKRMKARKG